MSLSGLHRFALPPLWLRRRSIRLDATDPAVFEAWCASSDSQTLDEFCEAEWTRAPQAPPPAPPPKRGRRFDPDDLPPELPDDDLPVTPFGGTAEVTPTKPVMPPNFEVIG